jgi:hypothetical protein
MVFILLGCAVDEACANSKLHACIGCACIKPVQPQLPKVALAVHALALRYVICAWLEPVLSLLCVHQVLSAALASPTRGMVGQVTKAQVEVRREEEGAWVWCVTGETQQVRDGRK